MLSVNWKVERCLNCCHFAVKSQDEFFDCLKCREQLLHDQITNSLERSCVFCGQPLILLMESCLHCGNQPKLLQTELETD